MAYLSSNEEMYWVGFSLERAVSAGDLGRTENLIRELGDGFDVNKCHASHASLLHAFFNEDQELPRQGGPWPRRRPITPDKLRVLRLLLDLGADVNLEARTLNCMYGGPIINIMCKTPLHLAKDLEVAELLLDHGADVNHRDSYGWTVLMSCVKIAKCLPPPQGLPLVQFLVRRGADLSARCGSHCGLSRNWDGTARIAPRNMDANKTSSMIARGDWAHDSRADVADYLEHAMRVELLRLRTLCARGRAEPLVMTMCACLEPLNCECVSAVLAFANAPPERVLERLFSSLLPNEVFWHILTFWGSPRPPISPNLHPYHVRN